MHNHGMRLIFKLMKETEKEWEKQNSVPAKLESNEAILRKYFMMVSQGVEKTQLFAATMANTLENVIFSAFEKEMVQKTLHGIRKKRWLNEARFIQKHMDLHLIDLLEKKKLNEALDNISFPKRFYAEVLQRLIAQQVPNGDSEWHKFKNDLRRAIDKAAIIEVKERRAQTFVNQLRKEFFEGYLQSETLGSAFRIDCSGEYEDCDNEEQEEFKKECKSKLLEVLKKQVAITRHQKVFAKELSKEVVQHMIKANDKAALPRCDECCRLCKSLCIEAANHKTPHEAVHQPGGVAGVHFHRIDKLDATTCSQHYEQDDTFLFNNDPTVKYKYRDFATVFRGWRNPRIIEEMPVREYILATYNKEIAEKYKVKPSENIPASYFRDLSSIKKQLERDIASQ
ncbi:uncharacterized protein LOC124314746 [Daphnia pulicaria]|uniref:uncharacterized protein LOC124314746 n=1 Tax=Daphnia pulicaria TaxID=35523 RepID=UPI001EE9FB0A|nr:uncharacterized protein LOC124314746 [Daphnia pulicaria]